MIKGTAIKLTSQPHGYGNNCTPIKSNHELVKFTTELTNIIQEGNIIELEGDNITCKDFVNVPMEIKTIKKTNCNEIYCQILYSSQSIHKDNINPDHYKHGAIETIDYLLAISQDMNPQHAICVANGIKYLSRFHKKNGLEDVKKAQWYINKLIEIMETETL